MRKEYLFNKDWKFFELPDDFQVKTHNSIAGVFNATKASRLNVGPGTKKHFDTNLEERTPNLEINTENWVDVNLPHDFMISHTPKQGTLYPTGHLEYKKAWYRKHFSIDESDKDKRVTVLFEGVKGKTSVYINGCFIKQNN